MLNILSKKLILLVVIAVFLVTSGLGCKGGNPAAMKALNKRVDIEWWGVFDASDSYNRVIHLYQKKHPNVVIKYRKLRFAEYEQALLEAWAKNQGPDIFYVHNTWVGKYKDQLLPMPESIKLPIKEYGGLLGNEEQASFRVRSTPSVQDIQDTYVDVVIRDVVRDGEVLALPVALDTLALYYNKALLNQSGILNPPGTWAEVADSVKHLTRQDEFGDIVQSGIALGTADNIPRSSDILILLMMQNGSEITDGRKVVWNLSSSKDRYRPGPEALRFYTDFASPAKEVYTWNQDMPNALDAFVQGRLAYMIGYSYQLPVIRSRGPSVDLGIAPIPHINSDGTDALRRSVNLANYWLQGAHARTDNPDEVWDFLLYLTSEARAREYLTTHKRPSARRGILKEQIQDPVIAPFARAALTSKNWYQGRNPQAAEAIIEDTIRDVLEGKMNVNQSLKFHSRRLEKTL